MSVPHHIKKKTSTKSQKCSCGKCQPTECQCGRCQPTKCQCSKCVARRALKKSKPQAEKTEKVSRRLQARSISRPRSRSRTRRHRGNFYISSGRPAPRPTTTITTTAPTTEAPTTQAPTTQAPTTELITTTTTVITTTTNLG